MKPPPPAVPSWATVARKKKGKQPTIIRTAAGDVESFHMSRVPTQKLPPYLARYRNMADAVPPPPPPPAPKRQQKNTTPPLRPRRLLVKRDGSDLTKTPLQLRDALNKALGYTAVLSTQIARSSAGGNTGHVSVTLMENLLATKLYPKVGEHLTVIPGAISLHLETPIVHIVVHGVPTSLPLELLQQELTTFNPGLTMS